MYQHNAIKYNAKYQNHILNIKNEWKKPYPFIGV